MCIPQLSNNSRFDLVHLPDISAIGSARNVSQHQQINTLEWGAHPHLLKSMPGMGVCPSLHVAGLLCWCVLPSSFVTISFGLHHDMSHNKAHGI